jgi:hypothetical protein
VLGDCWNGLLAFRQIFVLGQGFDFTKNLILSIGNLEEFMYKLLKPFIVFVHLQKVPINILNISTVQKQFLGLLPLEHLTDNQVVLLFIHLIKDK